MSETRRWGKAGQRLTSEQAASRDAAAVARRNRSAAAKEKDLHQARRRWEAGLVVPWRITHALDMHKLEGPEVDIACGAEEPDVDRWELGELYPTWEQLLLLVELTQYPIRFFTMYEVEPMHPLSTSLRFHVAPHVLASHNPALRFPEHVWRPIVERAEVSP